MGDLVFLPRPHYYGAPLQVRALRLVPVISTAAGLALFKKGALDIARVPGDQMSRVSSRSVFHSSDALAAYYAVPSLGSGARYSAVLDRDRLVQDLSPELSTLSSIVPPSVPDYAGSSPSLEAGSGSPSATVSHGPPDDRVESLLQVGLQNQWDGHSPVPTKFRIVHAAYELPDPGRWLLTVLPETRSGWFRRLLQTANTLTNDPVSRMNLYEEAETWALEQGLIVPLATDSVAFLIRPSVQSLQVTPEGVMPENNNWSLVSVS